MASKKLTYTLTKQGSKVCTVNKNTGKVIACYANRAGAITALKALYAGQGDKVGADKKTANASLDAASLTFDMAMGCFEDDCERSFFTFSAFSKHLESVHPEETAAEVDDSKILGHPCRAEGCSRTFHDAAALQEHAEAVHTFDDMRTLVAEAVREAYGSADPNGRIWTWIEAMAPDWVVFTIEKPNDVNLYKAPYLISSSNVVTLGDPVEVIRRTVYDAVENPDPLPTKNTAATSNGM